MVSDKTRSATKSVIVSLLSGLISFSCTIFYYYRYTDDVAQTIRSVIQRIGSISSYHVLTTSSYILAEFAVPLAWGLAWGVVAAGLLERSVIEGIKNHWRILVFSAFCALFPGIYYTVGMTFFMEGS